MGLDMYAFSVPAGTLTDEQQVDFQSTITKLRQTQGEEACKEIFYWRKHHDLHGWMAALYDSKDGQSPDFNLDPVRLTEADLDDLEQAVKDNQLPATSGFFFGNNPPDAESVAEDLKFIEIARAELAAGRQVFYDSWW